MTKASTKSLTKVVYKPSTQSTDEFTIIVNADEYKKYKEGDTTIPLTEVVDSFQIFFSNQGSQGILGAPSKQQLENVFGSSKDVDVVQKILESGLSQAGDGIKNSSMGGTNMSIGSMSLDTKGRSLRG